MYPTGNYLLKVLVSGLTQSWQILACGKAFSCHFLMCVSSTHCNHPISIRKKFLRKGERLRDGTGAKKQNGRMVKVISRVCFTPKIIEFHDNVYLG